MKQSKIGWKFAEQWLPKAKILGPADEETTRFFEKCTDLKSSMERKNFMKLKKTQLFHLVIKLIEPFAVPRACTR